MARKTDEQEETTTEGEQLELIDVGPENLKTIKPLAKKYKAAQRARMEALEQEIDLKEKILAAIHDANLSRLQDGTIRFKCDGMVITVKPRDELVKVKEENQDEE